MSGPRPARPMPLLLASLLMVTATGPLQAAPSPTEALVRAAQTGTSPTGSQPGSAPGATQPGTTQPGTPDPGATPPSTPTQPPPLPLPVIPPAPNQSPVRVGLGRSLTTTQTQAAEGLYILVDNRLVATTGPGAVVTLTLVGTGQIQLGGQVEPVPNGGAQPQPQPQPLPKPMAPVSGTVRLVPKPAPPPRANWATYGKEPYRGEGEVKYSPIKGKLTFVNTVNLEEYLLGVVPEEVPALWPIEAVKAQAVAARTYALCNLGGYPSEFFDLTDTTADQAYGGVKSEHPNSTAAVHGTTGEVVRYNGQMITTYYSASTGGHTESMEVMFGGGSQPYLVGVLDFDNVPGNTNYAWSKGFNLADLKARLATQNINVGEITTIAPEGTPGPGGHPPKWKVTGTNGQAVITGSRIRTALGLLAAPRAVKLLTASGAVTTGAAQSPAAAGLPVTGAGSAAQSSPPQTVKVLGANGRLVDRPVAGGVVQGADGRSTTLSGAATARGADGRQVAFQPSAPTPPPPPPTPAPGPGPIASVQFDGGGNGHGIGLSQWGAYGMALQGKTYREILTHYYTGTKVEKP